MYMFPVWPIMCIGNARKGILSVSEKIERGKVARNASDLSIRKPGKIMKLNKADRYHGISSATRISR